MIKLFDTCDVLQYCVPPKETTPPEPETEPETESDEWLIPDKSTNIKKSWRLWSSSHRTRSAVRAVPAVYSENFTQEMKRDTQSK